MSDELRECPNPACRSTDLIVVLNFYSGSRFCLCRACLMTGPHMPTEGEAKAAWDGLMRPLEYSSERPKVVGDYKARYASDHGSQWVMHLTRRDLAQTDVWFDGLEFAGPIPTPLEPLKQENAC